MFDGGTDVTDGELGIGSNTGSRFTVRLVVEMGSDTDVDSSTGMGCVDELSFEAFSRGSK